MIRYTLQCSNDHRFESWFQSGSAFDRLVAANQLSCPDCGDVAISKSLMAPQVRGARDTGTPEPALSSPADNPARAALAELRRKIEASAEDVGTSFVREARRIHAGESPERSIYGQARADEARKLVEDGIPVAPLPFIPTRKTN